MVEGLVHEYLVTRPLPMGLYHGQSFYCIQKEAGDIKPKWAMVHASIAEMAARNGATTLLVPVAAAIPKPSGGRQWLSGPSKACLACGTLKTANG